MPVLYRRVEYTEKDRNELEQQIMSLKSAIRANEFILSSRYKILSSRYKILSSRYNILSFFHLFVLSSNIKIPSSFFRGLIFSHPGI